MSRVAFVGDLHLSSRQRGVHRNYPAISFEYLTLVTDRLSKYGDIDYIVLLGDLTYGNFSLDYRTIFEDEFQRLMKIPRKGIVSVRGNHDTSTGGMTEWEYYVRKGWIKRVPYLIYDKFNVTCVDYNEEEETNILVEDGKSTIIAAHNTLTFGDGYGMLSRFGTNINDLQNEGFRAADMIVCGHIHKHMILRGSGLYKGKYRDDMLLYYPGCGARPIREKELDDFGYLLLIEETDTDCKLDEIQIPLRPPEQVFMIDDTLAELGETSTGTTRQNVVEKDEATLHIDDVVQELDAKESMTYDPEVVISNMADVDVRYRKKAIELYRKAVEG